MLRNTRHGCSHLQHLGSTRRHASQIPQLSGSSLKELNTSVNALVYIASDGFPVTGGLPLSSFSVAVKDNICTSAMPTTCSSAMLHDFISPFDATVVKLLQDGGAYISGKTNCDEFGMGCVHITVKFARPYTRQRSLNMYSVHGPVINPYQPADSSVSWTDRERRSAGGSSGGSAAAVAVGMCDA